MRETPPILKREPMDMPFALLTILLLTVGLIMLFSASFPSAYYETGDYAYYFKRQLAFAAAGVLVMFIMSKLDYHLLRVAALPLLILSLALVVVVLIPGVGAVRNNARRWLILGSLSIQPSELAKLAIIVSFSASISKKKDAMHSFWRGVFPYAATLAAYGALIGKEPHLSGAVLVVGVGAALMFAGGIRWRYVFIGVVLVSVFAWLMLTGKVSYGQSRIAMWHDPFSDATGEGYQLSQSLIAIGSGGLFGVGLGRSRQKFLYLPEEHNDFIFSIVCEELGYLGAGLILLLFAAIIIRGYILSFNAPDRFGRLLIIGVITLFAMQTFLNIAVISALMPTTGISLPLFSYGGSALLVQLFEMGIVLSVSRQID